MRSAKVLFLDDDEYCDNGHVPSLTVEHAIAEAEIVFHRGAVIKNRCGPIGKIVPDSVIVRSKDWTAFDARLDALAQRVDALVATHGEQKAA